jgi:predicted PurR-regulated permease PerM
MQQDQTFSSSSAVLRQRFILQYIVYGALILYFGRDIFVPISVAVLISFVLYPACAWMERRGIGRMTAIVLNVGALTILLLMITALFAQQVVSFLQEWPALQPKLERAFDILSRLLMEFFGIAPESQAHWMDTAGESMISRGFGWATAAISASAISAVMAILIPVYAVLILYYRGLWVRVLIRIMPEGSEANIMEMLSLTIQAYYNFIKGMGIVYLVVGILNSVGLFFLGVPHALLFGLIASILTFIPYVGIMVGSLLPVTIAWATHDSGWYAVGVIGVFAFVQYLEANVIFPIAVSSRLKVNTLVVLISIFLGAVLWGVAGMILFVPLVGIIKLIADHNPSMKTISMVLGTGKD